MLKKKQKWKNVEKVTAVVLAVIIMLLAAATYARNGVWENGVRLWSDVVSKSPEKAKPHFNLGNAYKENEDLINAEIAWRRTIEIEPRNSLALNQLGNVHLISGMLLEAKEYYTAAVESDKTHAEARYNLALTLEKLNEIEGALRNYELFLETVPPEYHDLIPKVRERISLLSQS